MSNPITFSGATHVKISANADIKVINCKVAPNRVSYQSRSNSSRAGTRYSRKTHVTCLQQKRTPPHQVFLPSTCPPRGGRVPQKT
jgi:hypothetical protein